MVPRYVSRHLFQPTRVLSQFEDLLGGKQSHRASLRVAQRFQESVPNNDVHLILMSELVKRYHGGVDYFTVTDVTDEQRQTAIRFGFDQLGKLYDHWGVLRFLWFVVAGQKRRSRERSYWYCSEIVAEAYRLAGAPFVEHRTGYVAPADIAASPRVRFAFRLKRE